jgi:hypothetical protein
MDSQDPRSPSRFCSSADGSGILPVETLTSVPLRTLLHEAHAVFVDTQARAAGVGANQRAKMDQLMSSSQQYRMAMRAASRELENAASLYVRKAAELQGPGGGCPSHTSCLSPLVRPLTWLFGCRAADNETAAAASAESEVLMVTHAVTQAVEAASLSASGAAPVHLLQWLRDNFVQPAPDALVSGRRRARLRA